MHPSNGYGIEITSLHSDIKNLLIAGVKEPLA